MLYNKNVNYKEGIMKGKIGTILLVIVLMVLVAACSILGVKYLDNRN